MRGLPLLGLVAVLLAGLSPAARAEDLVVTLSTREVAITSTYTGTEITAFGLIERDASTIARIGAYEVVVAVQGPAGDVVVQRKDQYGPIWLTDSRQRYSKVPLFFSRLSAKPIETITDENTRQRLKLGLEHYLPADNTFKGREKEAFAFRNALLRLRREQGGLIEDSKAVTMIRPNLFTARIALPATAPTGLYLVNLSVLSEGVPLKTVQAGFVVRKVGFDAFVANSARTDSWGYAAFAVLMAMLLGWLANVVFRKD